jgi:serine/threonine protein kinase, bacterial
LVTRADADGQRILLTDFGIAGQSDDPGHYAAPEQLTGSDIDGRADQYGLAATAFQLLTGSPPSPDPGAKLSDRRVDLAQFDSVFSTALAGDPADRFASCLGFAQALTEASSPGERSPAVHTSKVRRRRIPVGIAIAAGLALCVALLAVGIFIGRKNGTTSTDAQSPGAGRAAVSGAPPLVVLDGGYRLDLDREKQTYNQTPDPQPPNVTTWWAFRSSCTPAGCFATAVVLDDANHQTPNPATGLVVFDLRADAWQSRPETAKFPCRAKDGTAAMETITQSLSLQPQSQSSLRGTMTVTVQTNECGQIGGRIVIPAVAARVSDLPPGVDIPSPPPMTTPPR